MRKRELVKERKQVKTILTTSNLDIIATMDKELADILSALNIQLRDESVESNNLDDLISTLVELGIIRKESVNTEKIVVINTTEE